MSVTNDQIMKVLGDTVTSTEQLCDRLRDLFGPSLEDLEQQVYDVNYANGWFDGDRDFAADVALLHTEVSEIFEAYRDFEHQEVYREPSGVFAEEFERPDGGLNKPEGVGSEAADVLIRLLDTCRRRKIPLLRKTQEKIRYNATRGYKHGGKII